MDTYIIPREEAGFNMSSPRYPWWGYVKAILREYPAMCREAEQLHQQSTTQSTLPGSHSPGSASRTTETLALRELPGVRGRQYQAIQNARAKTASYRDGPERLHLISLVFWEGSHTLHGAALACNVSYRTATQWHGEFIRLTASFLELLD